MKKESRAVCYDETLRIEACRLEGFAQPFPSHFHEHYVIGCVEGGARSMRCKNKEYALGPGDVVLFNPGDSHACAPRGGSPLDYHALHIPQETMLELAGEIAGRRTLPGFSRPIVRDEELTGCLRPLHRMVMEGSGEFEKEEYLLLLVTLLLERYSQPFESLTPECREEIESACAFLQAHYAEHISLEQICRCAGLSRSTLLRAFTRSKGVTPYRYLETVRINEAKKRLERGLPPLEAAMQTGFADQSHFTAFFSRFTGLSPGMYREIFRGRGPDEEEARHGA